MIELQNVNKYFNRKKNNEIHVINDTSLNLPESGIVALLGPSGCGKTTLLNAIGGLDRINSGKIYVDGECITRKSSNKVDVIRNAKIGYIFQNYNLLDNRTVFENVAIALRMVGMKDREQVKERVNYCLEAVGIYPYRNKMADALSGGQRQRVALGRAMVRDPAVFLLDEPLSNLDAKLRTEMRARIAELHRELGTTFVYVTHDQTEAMTMADRIVVMLDGKIQQADTPEQLYAHPCNVFVAGFIGTPPMNILPGRLVRRGNTLDLQVLGTEVALPRRLQSHAKLSAYVDRDVLLGLRAEDLSTDPAWLNITDSAAFRVQVEMAERMGAETYLYADLQGRRVIARVPGTVSFQKDDQTVLYPNMEALHLFDPETEVCICD